MSRGEIIDGMARALWISAYADWVEGLTKKQREKYGTPVNLSGIEWDDAAPDTPDACQDAAVELAELYETDNGVPLTELAERAATADGKRRVNLESFGHYLAMMAMGTGVSWFDDHSYFALECPTFECSFGGEFLDWSGSSRTRRQRRPTPPPRLVRKLWLVSTRSGFGDYEGIKYRYWAEDEAGARQQHLAEHPRGAAITKVEEISPVAGVDYPASNPRRKAWSKMTKAEKAAEDRRFLEWLKTRPDLPQMPEPVRIRKDANGEPLAEDVERAIAAGAAISNPAGDKRWRVWCANAPDSYVNVDASDSMDAIRKAAPSFKSLHNNEVVEMIAKRDGSKMVEHLVTINVRGVVTFHRSPPRGNPPKKRRR